LDGLELLQLTRVTTILGLPMVVVFVIYLLQVQRSDKMYLYRNILEHYW